MLSVQKPENTAGLSPTIDCESSASGSLASCSKSSRKVMFNEMKDGRRKSASNRGDDSTIADSFPEKTQAGDLFSAAVGDRRLPLVRKDFVF